MDGEGKISSSPFLFQDQVYKWLETALDFGVSEKDFWEMTFAELTRLFESKARTLKIQEQQKASFDYILADLIGRSISRLYNSSNKMPTMSDVYPNLFSKEEEAEKIQKKKEELSILRFKQFAQSYNSRFKEVGKENE